MSPPSRRGPAPRFAARLREPLEIRWTPAGYGQAMLDETSFAAAVAELTADDPDLAAIVDRHGLPSFWAREPGLATLVLLILEQQVSLASARAAYDRLVGRLGGLTRGESCARPTRSSAGRLQPPKGALRSALARAIEEGSLDLDAVALLDDEAARAALVALPGIGRTAEVYPLGAPATGHVARRGHRAAGGCATRTAPRGAVAGRARADRRGVAAAPGDRRPPAVAPVPQRPHAVGRGARGEVSDTVSCQVVRFDRVRLSTVRRSSRGCMLPGLWNDRHTSGTAWA